MTSDADECFLRSTRLRASRDTHAVANLMKLHAIVVFTAVVGLAACYQHHRADSSDADVAEDGTVPDADTELDASSDGSGSCDCPADRPVTLFHACSPPLESGCAAEPCEPGVTGCGEGFTCEPCAAAACCTCSACVASCVFTGPAQGPLPEYLKLQTTYGPADEEQTIVVEGFPFYVGALFYLARVGDSGDLMEAGYPGSCARAFTAPARGPSTVPVWISQYGGDEPWVLAGFFSYVTGAVESCVQPGLSCSGNQLCCETAEVPMVCEAGRCRRP
jgi:hypothetical protein